MPPLYSDDELENKQFVIFTLLFSVILIIPNFLFRVNKLLPLITESEFENEQFAIVKLLF